MWSSMKMLQEMQEYAEINFTIKLPALPLLKSYLK